MALTNSIIIIIIIIKIVPQHNDSRSTAVYEGQPGEPTPELSETLTQYTILIVLKFLTNTPKFPGLPVYL